MANEVELCVEVGSNIGDTWLENADINQLCRSCANTHDNMIPIFEGDGLEHDLKNKIDKHFPVNISKDDELPHQMCYQCASTLVAWHDMVTCVIDADKKLKDLLKKSTNKKQVAETVVGSSIVSEDSASNESKSEQKMGSEMEIDNDDNDNDYAPEHDDDDDDEDDDEDNDQEEDDGDDDDEEAEEVVLHKLEAKEKEKTVEVTEKGTTIRDQYLSTPASSLSQIKSARKGCSDDCVRKCMKKSVKIKLACEECGKNSTKDVCLLYHIKQTHELFNAHKCIKCNVAFKCYLKYKMHIEEEHLVCVVGDEDSSSIQTRCKSIKKELSQEPLESLLCALKSSDDDSNHEVGDNYSVDNHNYSEAEDTKEKGKCSENEKSFVEKFYITCSICSKKCKTTLALIRHWRHLHTNEEAKSDPKYTRTINMHTCNICNKFFNDVRVLKKHKKEEHGIANGFSFSEEEEKQLKQVEVILESSGLKTYKCTFCSMVIKCGRRYLNHVAKHKGELPFRCEMCGKSFLRRSRLRAHVKVVHERVKDHKCQFCAREFGDKANMMDHVRKEHTREPYICNVCGETFVSSNRLYFHRRVHTNYKPHQCEECKSSFSTAGVLADHINRNHRKEKSFVCEICGKAFLTQESLRRHISTHSDARPFQCSTCDRAFKLKKTLIKHIQTQHPS